MPVKSFMSLISQQIRDVDPVCLIVRCDDMQLVDSSIHILKQAKFTKGQRNICYTRLY